MLIEHLSTAAQLDELRIFPWNPLQDRPASSDLRQLFDDRGERDLVRGQKMVQNAKHHDAVKAMCRTRHKTVALCVSPANSGGGSGKVGHDWQNRQSGCQSVLPMDLGCLHVGIPG